MRKLETNDWLVLNNIIYKIYSNNNLSEMAYNLIEQLRMIVSFDSASFYLQDVLEKHSNEGDLIDLTLFNCEFKTDLKNYTINNSKNVILSGKSMVYRETDINMEDNRENTEYYKRVYKPNNWHYSMQMILAYDKKFLGLITLYRYIGKEDFQYSDIFLLDMLKEHISFRLNSSIKFNQFIEEKVSVRYAVNKYNLTKREENILKMLMQGKDSIVICDELVISINTLKKHILNIYRKLGIKNRVQLFKKIREHDEQGIYA